MRKLKLKPEVFMKAAAIVLTHGDIHYRFCCNALRLACESRRIVLEPYQERLASTFKPKEETDGPWWGYPYGETIEARILALLLCAEMCKR